MFQSNISLAAFKRSVTAEV